MAGERDPASGDGDNGRPSRRLGDKLESAGEHLRELDTEQVVIGIVALVLVVITGLLIAIR